MSKFFDTAATVALTLSAIVMAGVLVRRELKPPARSHGPDPAAPPSYVQDWERFGSVGKWIGDSTAKIKIVEFTDFQCPFCKHLHDKFSSARDSLGKDVAVLLVQYPLEMHKFAEPAALAAECADRAGRWQAFQDLLFDKQDSLGLKSWLSFARDAKIADTASFAKCLANNLHSKKIDASRAAGKRINVTGTPTVIINGWRYSRPPYDSLVALAKKLLAEIH